MEKSCSVYRFEILVCKSDGVLVVLRFWGSKVMECWSFLDFGVQK